MAGEKTVKKWQSELDPKKGWFTYEVQNAKVVRLSCKLCKTFEDKVKYCRNFNRAFITGVTDHSKIKKDNVAKHGQSAMHKTALDYLRKPETRVELFRTTPIGRALNKWGDDEQSRVEKLIDIVYMLAKREKPFTMFRDIAELEKRHGVKLGETYVTDKKAQEFSECIAEVSCFSLIIFIQLYMY